MIKCIICNGDADVVYHGNSFCYDHVKEQIVKEKHVHLKKPGDWCTIIKSKRGNKE